MVETGIGALHFLHREFGKRAVRYALQYQNQATDAKWSAIPPFRHSATEYEAIIASAAGTSRDVNVAGIENNRFVVDAVTMDQDQTSTFVPTSYAENIWAYTVDGVAQAETLGERQSSHFGSFSCRFLEKDIRFLGSISVFSNLETAPALRVTSEKLGNRQTLRYTLLFLPYSSLQYTLGLVIDNARYIFFPFLNLYAHIFVSLNC
jgi:hypothetical protein